MKFLDPLRTIKHKLDKKVRCPFCDFKGQSFRKLPEKYYRQYYIHDETYEFDDPRIETMSPHSWDCPKCKANLKSRLYWLYLKDKVRSTDKVLHIAPEGGVREFFESRIEKKRYIKTDFIREDVDIKLDIRDMSVFNDEEFDVIVCSHVLEHIEKNHKKGIEEMYRVLKNKGFALIMVPTVTSNLYTFEKEWINTDELRDKYYGLNDHYRIYTSTGLIKDLEDAGFKVQRLGTEVFNEREIKKYDISKNCYLYIAHKII